MGIRPAKWFWILLLLSALPGCSVPRVSEPSLSPLAAVHATAQPVGPGADGANSRMSTPPAHEGQAVSGHPVMYFVASDT